MKEKDLHNELNKLAPELGKLPKEEGFRVPEGYFDQFSDQLMERMHQDSDTDIYVENTSEKIVQLRPSRWRYAAAIAILVLGALWGVNQYIGNPAIQLNQDPLAMLSASDIDQYISSNIDDFEDELLINEQDVSSNPFDGIDFNNEAIDSYIDENILDDLDENSLNEFL